MQVCSGTYTSNQSDLWFVGTAALIYKICSSNRGVGLIKAISKLVHLNHHDSIVWQCLKYLKELSRNGYLLEWFAAWSGSSHAVLRGEKSTIGQRHKKNVRNIAFMLCSTWWRHKYLEGAPECPATHADDPCNPSQLERRIKVSPCSFRITELSSDGRIPSFKYANLVNTLKWYVINLPTSCIFQCHSI